MFGPKVLLTYGGGPTTDYATSVFDVPAAVRATSVLDGGYHRLTTEEVEKIFRQSLRAPPLGVGDSPLSPRLCYVCASQRLSSASSCARRR